MFTEYTIYMANHFCGGSSRKLIAGWWYSILATTISITLVAILTIIGGGGNSNGGNQQQYSSSSNSNTISIQECIICLWSSILLCCFCVGGTMIMRKFHHSMAVGFFMGVTVSASPFCMALAFLYFHYRQEQLVTLRKYNHPNPSAKQETIFACLCLIQAILLGTFAILLAAHRTEILDDGNNNNNDNKLLPIVDNKTNTTNDDNDSTNRQSFITTTESPSQQQKQQLNGDIDLPQLRHSQQQHDLYRPPARSSGIVRS